MTIIPIPIPPEASKEAMELIKTFLGPAAKQVGELGGDYVRFFQFERQVKLLRRAQEILKEAGISPKAVNVKVLFPLLSVAALEDEEEMTQRWASLLASAANPSNGGVVDNSFIETLKQLSPAQAFVLDVFYEQIKRAEWSRDQ